MIIVKKRYVEIEIPDESEDINMSKDIDVPLEIGDNIYNKKFACQMIKLYK